MSYNQLKPGPNFVPAYQLSGVPYVTSSVGVTTTPVEIEFPQATRFFQVINTGDTSAHLRVGFTANGVNANPTTNGHYFILSGTKSTERLELRCKSVFIRADGSQVGSFSLIAGLSGVDAGDFPILTGSISGSGRTAEPRFKGVG